MLEGNTVFLGLFYADRRRHCVELTLKHVCVFMFMCVRVWVCEHAYVYVFECVCVCVCACVLVCVHPSVYVCVL